MACPSCFGLMFIGSKFCDHCGAIAAPLEVSLVDDAGECPRCRASLENLTVDKTAFRGCSECDGLWVDAPTFESICADRERQAAVLGFLNQRTIKHDQKTKIAYVPCPDCGELMNRNNFARASGVIVDICRHHGVWFDADELPAIVEFIQKGGMELARQRELTELKDERSRLREDQRKQAAQDSRFATGNILGGGEGSAIRGFIQSLFDQ